MPITTLGKPHSRSLPFRASLAAAYSIMPAEMYSRRVGRLLDFVLGQQPEWWGKAPYKRPTFQIGGVDRCFPLVADARPLRPAPGRPVIPAGRGGDKAQGQEERSASVQGEGPLQVSGPGSCCQHPWELRLFLLVTFHPVFERLFLKAKPGRGFMAPIHAYSFRSYIKKAVWGEAINQNKAPKTPQQKSAGAPASIAEAAEILNV